jgi:hypothetical protein
MPYFDSETTNSYEERTAFDGKEEKYILQHAFPNSSELHVAQTLDRFYYTSLESTRERDLDQVVYRYTKIQHELRKKGSTLTSTRQLQDTEQLEIPTQGNTTIPNNSTTELPRVKQKNIIRSSFQGEEQNRDGSVFLNSPGPPASTSSERIPVQDNLTGAPEDKAVPPVSLLMVQHLWMWKIDESKSTHNNI